jgi:hypothetical protein
MHLSRSFRRGVVLLALLALAMPLAALADGGKRDNDRCKSCDGRILYATDTRGNLLRFSSANPRKLRSKAITGLPAMVTIKGIDFRPASGDLYALGSDRVVYRLNPRTAIAVPEGEELRPDPLNPLRQLQRVRLQPDRGQDPRHERCGRQPSAEPRRRHAPLRRHEADADGCAGGRIGLYELVLHSFRDAPDGDRTLRLRHRREPGQAVDPAAGERGAR